MNSVNQGQGLTGCAGNIAQVYYIIISESISGTLVLES